VCSSDLVVIGRNAQAVPSFCDAYVAHARAYN
jgi:hypothetical protein